VTMPETMPGGMLGLRHVALFVQDMDAALRFYMDVMGMKLEWQPDADNYYLTSGSDNFALHRALQGYDTSGPQRLDHIGFIIKAPEDVDAWHAHLLRHNVKILRMPATHRDGARSLYCEDPAGNTLQLIYHPPISNTAV
jgi:catechol 2,3-dioxygenase-like lactoylglutathione lyase family enzyme